MGFQPDHAVWHRETQSDHIAEPGVCGPMQGCTAGVVLHVDVGVREFSEHLGVQQASGAGAIDDRVDECGAAGGVGCGAVHVPPERAGLGVLWEPAGIEAHGL